MDLVRRTLEEARRAARAQGKNVGQGRRSGGTPAVAGRRRGGRRAWSGPGPDARDPQLLAAASRELAAIRGWSERVAAGGVFGRWRAIVGEQIAERALPTALCDGVLSVTAESTSWATQLRMMQSELLAKIAAAVGDGVVTSLKITGPAAPSWHKGPRRVAGRGPRDTYG
jgi:predicted nucleic acid-binding Zn ribbon protein